MRSAPAPQLIFVQGTNGSITAHPIEVDTIVAEAWAKVYNGNVQDHQRQVADFLCKYRQYIYVHAGNVSIPAFTSDMILDDCENAPSTGAGWDQWECADWRLLSRRAADHLAQLLNGIEAGLDWPEPMLWGKAHLHAKESEPTTNPMDHRILLVLQRLYRR